MMTIKQIEVTVGDITDGYVNNEEQGVRGYGGKLDIRPPYQREFIYNEKEQQAVITTVLNGYPLNVMYWVKRGDDAECPYEVMDGQQRTLSLCEYVAGKFSYEFKNFFNQPKDIQRKILDYRLRGRTIGKVGVVQDYKHSRKAAQRAGNKQCRVCRPVCERCKAALLQVQLRCLPLG